MERLCRWWFAVLVLLTLAGCQGKSPAESPANPKSAVVAEKFDKVRGPAVAGLFYLRHEKDLKLEVDRLLADAKSERVENLRALICPHAGYEFSGPVAAVGYKQLVDRKFSTVILLGPSHYAAFDGAFVSTVDAYETPLGMVPISPKAAQLAKVEPFTSNLRCDVERPGWWRQSPKDLPPFGEDTPETWEHSLEVQLPFLQRTLHDCAIVPVVFGQVDPEQAADKLLPFLDDQTLIVVSTDLSHYHPYDEAKAIDMQTVEAICDLRADRLTGDDACGETPVLTLIDIARQKGWKARLLDYRNSGDTSGDKSRVVGYAAIAFFASDGKAASPAPKPTVSPLAPDERSLLLNLARKSITATVKGGEAPRQAADAP